MTEDDPGASAQWARPVVGSHAVTAPRLGTRLTTKGESGATRSPLASLLAFVVDKLDRPAKLARTQ